MCSDEKKVKSNDHTDHEINLLSHFKNLPGTKTMLINQDHQVEMICNP
jgi:hypothetical protein